MLFYAHVMVKEEKKRREKKDFVLLAYFFKYICIVFFIFSSLHSKLVEVEVIQLHRSS